MFAEVKTVLPVFDKHGQKLSTRLQVKLVTRLQDLKDPKKRSTLSMDIKVVLCHNLYGLKISNSVISLSKWVDKSIY